MDPVAFNELQNQPQQRPLQQSGFASRREFDVINLSDTGVNSTIVKQPKVQIHPRSNSNSNKDKVADLILASSMLAIEETLNLTDANGLAIKTPVSILQELFCRCGIIPSYELVQIEGAMHEPTFRYRVSYIDMEVSFTAMGVGRSKKEAKHSAARSLIIKLTGTQMADTTTDANAIPNNISASLNCDGATGVAGIGDNTDKIVGNPIGWLQEMCISRRWPLPFYETETEDGLPHKRFFTIACAILNFREIGKGKSKKIAKRQAAHKMWLRLQENPLDST